MRGGCEYSGCQNESFFSVIRSLAAYSLFRLLNCRFQRFARMFARDLVAADSHYQKRRRTFSAFKRLLPRTKLSRRLFAAIAFAEVVGEIIDSGTCKALSEEPYHHNARKPKPRRRSPQKQLHRASFPKQRPTTEFQSVHRSSGLVT